MQTYLGKPLFDFAPHFDNIEHGQLDDVTFKASGIGAATPWKPTTHLKRTLHLSFQFHTGEEWRAFKNFFAARGGSIEGFWLPLWLTDYPMIQIVGANEARITPIGFASTFTFGGQFGFAALIRPQGTGAFVEPHTIQSVNLATTENFVFAESIDASFDAARSILCGLIFARLATPQIDYQFISDGVIATEIDFDELPLEYPTV